MTATTNDRIRILVSDKLTDEGIELLKNGGRFEVVNDPDITPERLLETIGEYDALAIRSRSNVTRDVIERAHRLKVIGRAGVGVDNIDVDAATERGIIVMNTPDANTISTAEHTVSMTLALVRSIPIADRTMKEGKWEKKGISGTELEGKTIGVFGLGKIGRRVAAIMRGFGMRVLGYDPFVTKAAAEKLGIEVMETDEICKLADIITVHTPMTPETTGLINARRIELMKPSVFLVNCARGGIIDEDDLLDALRNKRIAGAALDVFRTEPLPADHPFRTLSNVVLSPHLAASTTEAQEKVTRDIAQQMVEVLSGGVIRNALNMPAIDPRELARLRPALILCERLGRFASQFCAAPVERIEVQYCGDAVEQNLSPMTTAVVKGYLTPQIPSGVNEVNAIYLARTRGIEIAETRCADTLDYRGLISLVVQSANGEENVIGGTLFHGKDPRLVLVNDKHFEVKLRGHQIVIQNRDVPGIIGSVGTMLGNLGINIADMNWGRPEPGADAVTVINIDSPISTEVVEKLAALPNIVSVRHIHVSDTDVPSPS